MPFNQLQNPSFQLSPQKPTNNGYQIAGQAAQQAGQAVSNYASIFEKMVSDRQASINEQNKLAFEEKKNNLYLEEEERKKQERLELENKQKEQETMDQSFWDEIGALDQTDPNYKQNLERAYLKYKKVSPEEYFKNKTKPEELSWKDKQDYLQEDRMELQGEKNKGRGKNNSNDNRYKKYSPDQARVLQQIDDGAITVEDVERKIYAQMDTLSLQINQLKEKAMEGDPAAREELKFKVKEKRTNTDFLKTLDTWNPKQSSKTSRPSTNNGGDTPPKIQQAMQWVQQNPNDPRTPGIIARLKREGYMR